MDNSGEATTRLRATSRKLAVRLPHHPLTTLTLTSLLLILWCFPICRGMPENDITTLANVASGPGFSWSDEMSQVTPSAEDLKVCWHHSRPLPYRSLRQRSLITDTAGCDRAAPGARVLDRCRRIPQGVSPRRILALIYGLATLQRCPHPLLLSSMEAGLKERADALATRQQDWATVTKMREGELEVSRVSLRGGDSIRGCTAVRISPSTTVLVYTADPRETICGAGEDPEGFPGGSLLLRKWRLGVIPHHTPTCMCPQWKKNKLRSELRETMAKEAEAAHTESDQLALANKYDLDTQKQITEGKGLQAEYDKLVAEEEALAVRQREELYQIKATYQDQVMAMNDQVSRQTPLPLPVSLLPLPDLAWADGRSRCQVIRATETWKQMKKDRMEIEAKHHYEKGNTEKEEVMFKHEREKVAAERKEIDASALATKHRIQADAKEFAEQHHVSKGRFAEARKSLIHG